MMMLESDVLEAVLLSGHYRAVCH